MFQQQQDWLTRENTFSAFTHGALHDFWQRREEDIFNGTDNLPVHFIRFRASDHDRVVVICPGRKESYVKYTELAYDLFHCHFDVVIIDHRGQGYSGRLLADTQRGHVACFSDYVDDLALFWQQQIASGPWRKRFILAHSMGGAIATLFLQRYPQHCDAIALCAPMFGIRFLLPPRMVRAILRWAENHPQMREKYAFGTGHWRGWPFFVNMMTHSRQRYYRNRAFYTDDPQIRIGGPTWHWLQESVFAGEVVLAGVAKETTPVLLLQAENERLVDNRMHDRYCALRAAAGHPCEGSKPQVVKGAYHEILLEKDAMRAMALTAIVDFFNRHDEADNPARRSV